MINTINLKRGTGEEKCCKPIRRDKVGKIGRRPSIDVKDLTHFETSPTEECKERLLKVL